MVDRKPIFDAAKRLGARFKSSVDVAIMDNAIDQALGIRMPLPMRVSKEGADEIKQGEGLRLVAYPDPGSSNGHPWTVGYGSTGSDIGPGTVWTRQQAEDRFAQDLAKFEEGVTRLLAGSRTTQDQFDALVSFAYNVGLDEDDDNIAEGLGDSTLLRLHKAGDFIGAAKEFGKWVYNDGRKMQGLVNRRKREAARYRRSTPSANASRSSPSSWSG